jgi:ankyrin repeat protein
MYFKITNESENHYGFQYTTGLNILKEKFNDDPNQSCCAGGFYFTNAKNIFGFLGYGVYLREVALPTDNPDFKMVQDADKNKWRANMIILGKRHDLFTVDTFKYLIDNGADIHAADDYALRCSAENGHLDIVKFLVENDANIHADDDYALRCSAENGHLDVVKYLVENGADIHVYDDFALGCSAGNGHLDIVKYLVENDADIHADDDYALRCSAGNGHLDIVKYVVENGADIHADNDYALRSSAKKGHTDIVKYLIENRANVNAFSVAKLKIITNSINKDIINCIVKNEKFDVIKYSTKNNTRTYIYLGSFVLSMAIAVGWIVYKQYK